MHPERAISAAKHRHALMAGAGWPPSTSSRSLLNLEGREPEPARAAGSFFGAGGAGVCARWMCGGSVGAGWAMWHRVSAEVCEGSGLAKGTDGGGRGGGEVCG